MLWNVLLVLVVGVAVRRYWGVRGYEKKDSYNMAEAPQIIAGIAAVVAVVLLVVSLINVAINASDVAVYRRSVELVELKTSQRDALAALVRDEMSLGQYEAVMAATTQTDILVILGNNAALFLVEKTRLLVAINSELNTLINGLAQDRIGLCAWADNPLTPRLPFIAPVCPNPITSSDV